MPELILFTLIKHTGKSGYAKDVNCIGFKSIDSASSDENADTLNYPVYAPYQSDRSFSYENWFKFRLNLNTDLDYTMNSKGLTFKQECSKYCYNYTYTKIKNICLWINALPVNSSIIRIGLTEEYMRPINQISKIAVEDIKTYYVDSKEFVNTVKIPLTFNGLNEIELVHLDNSINDLYIVLQQEVLSGLTNNLDYRPINIKLHYEIE